MTKNLGSFYIDAENGLVDSSAASTPIINNGVTISNTEYKYGNKSIEFTPNSGIIINKTDWQINTETTVDMWVKLKQNKEGSCLLTSRQLNQDKSNTFWFGYYGGKLVFVWEDTIVGQSSTNYSMDWTHVAFTIKNGRLYMFQNGIYLGDVPAGDIYFGENLNLGTDPTIYDWDLDGYIDNVRIVEGQALWTESFELNELALYYQSIKTPTSKIYNLGHKGNLRGKAKEGFIRPTLKQFLTSEDWNSLKIIGYTEDITSIPEAYSAATASHIINSNWLAWKAFDDGTANNSAWHSGSWAFPLNEWIKYDFGTPKRINKFTIKPHWEAGYLPYVCRDFRLEASNDDSNWVTISEHTDQLWSAVESKEYLVSNFKFYRYYRIYVTRTGDDITNASVVIGEIEFMEGIFE